MLVNLKRSTELIPYSLDTNRKKIHIMAFSYHILIKYQPNTLISPEGFSYIIPFISSSREKSNFDWLNVN